MAASTLRLPKLERTLLGYSYSTCRILPTLTLQMQKKRVTKFLLISLLWKRPTSNKSPEFSGWGDSNTGFFHKVVRARQSKNKLLSVYNTERDKLEDQKAISQEAVSFFQLGGDPTLLWKESWWQRL